MNDLVNALFEFGGAVVVWLSVVKLYRDKQIKGVFWPAWAFFAVWGIWNLYYYPSLDQWASFLAGIALVSGNIVWVLLAARYIYWTRP